MSTEYERKNQKRGGLDLGVVKVIENDTVSYSAYDFILAFYSKHANSDNMTNVNESGSGY